MMRSSMSPGLSNSTPCPLAFQDLDHIHSNLNIRTRQIAVARHAVPRRCAHQVGSLGTYAIPVEVLGNHDCLPRSESDGLRGCDRKARAERAQPRVSAWRQFGARLRGGASVTCGWGKSE